MVKKTKVLTGRASRTNINLEVVAFQLGLVYLAISSERVSTSSAIALGTTKYRNK
ncbi:hypothetical protein [Microcoleus vaginatus]|uniref:hypothetical protein n=1 Tax=Microcoleus vaginatus TaxID=119532 RepID=UPI0032AE6C26